MRKILLLPLVPFTCLALFLVIAGESPQTEECIRRRYTIPCIPTIPSSWKLGPYNHSVISRAIEDELNNERANTMLIPRTLVGAIKGIFVWVFHGILNTLKLILLLVGFVANPKTRTLENGAKGAIQLSRFMWDCWQFYAAHLILTLFPGANKRSLSPLVIVLYIIISNTIRLVESMMSSQGSPLAV